MQDSVRYSQTLVKKNQIKNKGKLGLRVVLLMMVNRTSSREKTVHDDGNTAAAAIICVHAPTFRIILYGESGAVKYKLLERMNFIVTGLFREVNLHRNAAVDKIKEMIGSFGGTVNTRFSKNTSEYSISWTFNLLIVI